MWELLGVLFSAVLIIGLAYWFTRHFVGRTAGLGMAAVAKGPNPMVILAHMPLGKDQRLVLVQVGERYFLLGVATSEISCLAEFTREEAEAWRSDADHPEDGQPMSFGKALQKVLKQKGQR